MNVVLILLGIDLIVFRYVKFKLDAKKVWSAGFNSGIDIFGQAHKQFIDQRGDLRGYIQFAISKNQWEMECLERKNSDLPVE